MKRFYLLTLLVPLLALAGAAAATAQTPDGLPPALETVCDAETGAAFGLCNAYCEAMDCEVDNTNASPQACDKVSAKFHQITGRNLPCEVTCPCNDYPDFFPLWAAALADSSGLSCAVGGAACEEITWNPAACADPFDLLVAWGGEGFIYSSLNGFLPVPVPFCGDAAAGGVLPISPEQGAECRAQLEVALNSAGVTCASD